MSENATIRTATDEIAAAIGRGTIRAHAKVPEPIRRVAALLRGNGGEAKDDDGRKHERHQLIVPCRLTYDTEGMGALRGHDGFVHNIARGGVGLLIDVAMTRGDLVEIKFEINGIMTFLCGVIVFCRHIEGNVHEVGVQLHQRSDSPLLAILAASSDKDNPEWFNTARTKLCESRSEKKR